MIPPVLANTPSRSSISSTLFERGDCSGTAGALGLGALSEAVHCRDMTRSAPNGITHRA